MILYMPVFTIYWSLIFKDQYIYQNTKNEFDAIDENGSLKLIYRFVLLIFNLNIFEPKFVVCL